MCILYLNDQTVELLDELVEKGSETMDMRNKDEVVSRMKAAVASKQFGQEGTLCPLIADVSTSTRELIHYFVGFIVIMNDLLSHVRHASKSVQKIQQTLM